jgi:flagellar biosynthetic protein FliQ
MEAFDALVRAALVATATIALPVLVVTAVAGTAVAVVQAATQVQEQTLSFLPKALAVGTMLAFFGTFAMNVLARLFHDALAALPSILAGS